MNRMSLEQRVKNQGFTEDDFWTAASYIFQADYGVTQWNEPAEATDEQIAWALEYQRQYDGHEDERGDRHWMTEIIDENMWQNARSAGLKE